MKHWVRVRQAFAPVAGSADSLDTVVVSVGRGSLVGGGDIYGLSGAADAPCRQGQCQGSDGKRNV